MGKNGLRWPRYRNGLHAQRRRKRKETPQGTDRQTDREWCERAQQCCVLKKDETTLAQAKNAG